MQQELGGPGLPGGRLIVSPDSRVITLVTNDKSVRIWDLATGQEMHKFSRDKINKIAFSPDSKIIATCDGSRVRLWDSKSIQESPCPNSRTQLLYGQRMSSMSALIEVVTQQIDKDNTVTMLSISPTRRIVASTSSDRIVRLWDMDTAEEIEQLNHEGHVRQLICSDDGNLVACHIFYWRKWCLGTQTHDLAVGCEERSTNSVDQGYPLH
jgi:WD40 repeat protein